MARKSALAKTLSKVRRGQKLSPADKKRLRGLLKKARRARANK
jgi:hypothetical protein